MTEMISLEGTYEPQSHKAYLSLCHLMKRLCAGYGLHSPNKYLGFLLIQTNWRAASGENVFSFHITCPYSENPQGQLSSSRPLFQKLVADLIPRHSCVITRFFHCRVTTLVSIAETRQ
jgi:hypothetical protein